MKKISFFLLLLGLFLNACSDDTGIALCNCEADEYCVDDVCYETDGDVAPMP